MVAGRNEADGHKGGGRKESGGQNEGIVFFFTFLASRGSISVLPLSFLPTYLLCLI